MSLRAIAKQSQKMRQSRRIGILGGTFNPIHLGHLVLAEQAKQLLGLEKVLFVPANLPPHKRVKELAPAQKRYHMVALAVKSNPAFLVSDSEITRGGVSYSVETLREFKSTIPHTSLYFIVGSDFLEEFFKWKDIDEISKICKFVIARRPTHPFTQPLCNRWAGFKKLPRNILAIDITALDISSTDIRKRIKAKKSIRYLVPEEVRRYILRKKLYQ